MTQPNNPPDFLSQWLDHQIDTQSALQQATALPQPAANRQFRAPEQQLQAPSAPPQPPEQPPAAGATGGGDPGDDAIPRRTEDGSDTSKKHVARYFTVGSIATVGICAIVYLAHFRPQEGNSADTAHQAGKKPAVVRTHSASPHHSASPSVLPSKTVVPSTSASSAPSTSSKSSPADIKIPAFTVKDLSLPSCETIATVTSSQIAPIGVDERFTSFKGAGNTTVNDPHPYSMQPKAGAADAKLSLSNTTPMPVQVCIKNPADAITAEKAPSGMYALQVDLSKILPNMDTSELGTLAPAVTTTANGVPALLNDLHTAVDPKTKKPTPIAAEANTEMSENWANKTNPPVSPILNQFKDLLSKNATNLSNAAIAEVLGQVDNQSKSVLTSAFMNNLRADVQSSAEAWAKAESKTLHTTVPVPSVSIDAKAGTSLASMEQAYLKKNPDAVKFTSAGLLQYVQTTAKQQKKPKPTDITSAIALYNTLSISLKNPLPPYVETPAANSSNQFTVTPTTPAQTSSSSSATPNQ